MRIALACPYAWDATGGVQVHVRQLADRLVKRGHRVMVLAPASTTPVESHVVAVGRPVRVPYNGSVAPICPTPASARRVRRALDEFRPEVIHAHEPLIPGTAMFATRFPRAPVVATFHAYADRALLFAATAPALRGVWRRLAVRIAVSEAAAGFVAGRFPRDGLRVIPNGAEVEAFAGAEPARLPEGRRILFVNRLDRRKGFPVMVGAFARLTRRHPDALLVVAGDGKERRAVRSLPPGVRDRVVMLGSVPHDLLPPYHAACEVFCAPATGRESFGIVLVEAMAAGLPVVASDIPGYREVVRHEVEGILVPPSDPGRLAGAVGRLLDEPELARTMGQAGRARAGRYSWDQVAREVEAAYEEALGGR
ncbi:MAG: glycosyltransferase family 4 protein [Actinomycetota bacterium]